MNIVYISHLLGSQFGGPNYSVPAQVAAQKKYDNVFWYNLSEPVMEHWKQTGSFHNLNDYPEKRITALPEPFNKPDLVIFEDFYYIDDCKLGKECRKNNIPYIIVPRGVLTKRAQATKRIKKTVANAIFFKPFTRKAVAIEYLTESEMENSGPKWNKKNIIIPNGVKRIPFVERNVNKEYISGVFIGRFMPAKGIDLLVDAVSLAQSKMRESKVRISLYGPKGYSLWQEIADKIIENKTDDILSISDAVVGEEKDKVLRAADFFIMTSRFEGMPMGLIEALGYSLPCIVTGGTNMRTEIEAANAGWGCDIDAESIAGAIGSLCDNINDLSSYRERAYKLACEYDWDALAGKAHLIYEKIANERGKQ